ncbi:hypothetical protein [Roseobacter ponti]|uniref:Uncharacterized protein n=1 Tax=Roseobacter ponti TaxID=1891787 RepID=A0A858SQN8_9RHOB|nr:hypothetical protein [Roseobacter ponti]QJF50003.1 hypothetical protein G3256_01865 [Roseobacter ponti]
MIIVTGNRRAAQVILRAVICAVICAIAMIAQADDGVERPAGLMWNRTGLPAVFPLQVQSAPGADYYMTLRDTETGEAALAAFIRGGEFFRVLVPPGTFTVAFATGRKWRGEDLLFGPAAQTRRFTLENPLTFQIRDRSTRAGHIVDITDMAEGETARITVTPKAECRTRILGAGDLMRRPASEVFVSPREGRFLWDERRRAAQAGQPFTWRAPDDDRRAGAEFEVLVAPLPATRPSPC